MSDTINLQRADGTEEGLAEQVHHLFTYHKWDDEQVLKGQHIRGALEDAYVAIIKHSPPCPTRTRALNMLVDARMLANAAITRGGKY